MRTADLRRMLLSVGLLGALLAGTGYAARKGYGSLRQTRLLKQARCYLQNEEEMNALACVQEALRSDPNDVLAVRLSADLAERRCSRTLVTWRSRVVELAPPRTDDRLNLVRNALAAHDQVTASNALKLVNEVGRDTTGYHHAAGSIAMLAGQFPVAEAHFLEAARLQPLNPVPRLHLAMARLQQTNQASAARARSTLTRLSTNPVVACQALRVLVGDAARRGQTNEVLGFATQLVDNPNCILADKLLHLNLLRATQSSSFASVLARLEQENATNPLHAAELGAWLLSSRGASEALHWLEGLPEQVKAEPLVALILAQCLVAVADWSNLQSALEHAEWGPLDFFRHAFLARALRGLDCETAARGEWEQALNQARNNKNNLLLLLSLASDWTSTIDAEQVLWAFVKRFPRDKWASTTLSQLLYLRGGTAALLELYAELARANPSDLDVKNNLAATALLLGAREFHPHQLAREVYEKAPTNASYASTYAFSLYLQQRNAEAMRVIERLKPDELEQPPLAGYYGVLLRAAGNAPKAKKYLDLAAKASLLPEEKDLLAGDRRL